MAHTGVKPVKVTFHHDPPDPDVLRVVGYEGTCSCGWTGRRRDYYSYARDDAQRHTRQEHTD